MAMNKFFYLYLLGGIIALGLTIYDVATTYPHVRATDMLLDIIPGILLFYLAYKVYHEKKDKELM
jgi:hypothetical protein